MRHILSLVVEITGLGLISSFALASQWYWLPANPKDKCTIATYSPADVAEKMAMFGTRIVEKEGGMVVVLMEAQDAARWGPAIMGNINGAFHQVFFRTEEDCIAYQTKSQQEEQYKQRRYQEELEKYR